MGDFGWASAAIAGVSVVSSAVVAIVTPRYAAQRATELARENRVQQRLADAYLDVLRIVEREGLWWSAKEHNVWAAATEESYDPIPRQHPPAPDLADQATVAALFAAFGSEDVTALYRSWRTHVDDLELEHARLAWNWNEDQSPPSDDEMRALREHLGPAEKAARARLADAIAAELGHRQTR